MSNSNIKDSDKAQQLGIETGYKLGYADAKAKIIKLLQEYIKQQEEKGDPYNNDFYIMGMRHGKEVAEQLL